jgi:predicted Rossmann fold nucleotide-binding protein DprA/Smf involved in DNA uptake
MKVAIVGSRNSCEEDYLYLEKEIPLNASEIISGGAKGVDLLARRFAKEHGLLLTEIRPDYGGAAGRGAPLVRNREIVDAADMVFAFWDGSSKGTAYTISYCLTAEKPLRVVMLGDSKTQAPTPKIKSSTLCEVVYIGSKSR